MGNDGDGLDRRQFTKWAASIGLGSLMPGAVSGVAAGLERMEEGTDGHPEATRGNPRAPVQFEHPLERPHVRSRVEAARSGEAGPERFVKPHLRERLDQRDTVDLIVTTSGEATIVTADLVRGERDLHGYRASHDEVRRLNHFGEVVQVNEFS